MRFEHFMQYPLDTLSWSGNRKIMSETYNIFIKKNYPKIQDLPENEKQLLRDFVTEYGKDLNRKEKMELAEAYYSLNIMAEIWQKERTQITPK